MHIATGKVRWLYFGFLLTALCCLLFFQGAAAYNAIKHHRLITHAAICAQGQTKDCLLAESATVEGHDSSYTDPSTEGDKDYYLTIDGNNQLVDDKLYEAAIIGSAVQVTRYNGEIVTIACGNITYATDESTTNAISAMLVLFLATSASVHAILIVDIWWSGKGYLVVPAIWQFTIFGTIITLVAASIIGAVLIDVIPNLACAVFATVSTTITISAIADRWIMLHSAKG